MTHLEGAVKGYLVHDALHEGGFSLAVLSHESHFLSTLDGEVDIVEDVVRAVTLGGIFADDGIIATAHRAGELQVKRTVVHLIDLYGHHLLQLLDAALHLDGLGGLVAETLYEGLDVGYLLLLVLVGPKLLGTAFFPQQEVFVVLHLVVIDLAAGNLQRTRRDIVDEGPVVADEHHGTGTRLQELFEPLDGLDVEVVGRLIEQQHVRMLQEELGQFDAHAPAARELTRGTVEILPGKAQSLQGALQFSLVIHPAHHLQMVVEVGVALHQLHVVITLVVSSLQHLLVECFQLGLHPMKVGKGLFSLFPHRLPVTQHHDLWQVSHRGLLGHGNASRGGLLQSGQYLEHGALSGTVLAHEGHALTVVDDKTHILEESLGRKLYGKVVYGKHV